MLRFSGGVLEMDEEVVSVWLEREAELPMEGDACEEVGLAEVLPDDLLPVLEEEAPLALLLIMVGGQEEEEVEVSDVVVVVGECDREEGLS